MMITDCGLLFLGLPIVGLLVGLYDETLFVD